MIPTPYTVVLLRRSPGPENGYGEPAYTWTQEVVPVHGMSPGASPEINDPTREATEVSWTIYAPGGTPLPASVDQVEIPGLGVFPVIGTPQDWTLGPWSNPAAGVVFELGKVEG